MDRIRAILPPRDLDRRIWSEHQRIGTSMLRSWIPDFGVQDSGSEAQVQGPRLKSRVRASLRSRVRARSGPGPGPRPRSCQCPVMPWSTVPGHAMVDCARYAMASMTLDPPPWVHRSPTHRHHGELLHGRRVGLKSVVGLNKVSPIG